MLANACALHAGTEQAREWFQETEYNANTFLLKEKILYANKANKAIPAGGEVLEVSLKDYLGQNDKMDESF